MISTIQSESFICYFHYARKIYFEPKAHWVDIIHAMGHVFCINERSGPGDYFSCPGDCEKFHGWEFAIAKFIKAPINVWIMKNKNYSVSLLDHPDNVIEMGCLSKQQKTKYLKEALNACRDLKLLTSNNEPLSLR